MAYISQHRTDASIDRDDETAMNNVVWGTVESNENWMVSLIGKGASILIIKRWTPDIRQNWKYFNSRVG
jgi:hypothetical protein